jgi:hypothetical protein
MPFFDSPLLPRHRAVAVYDDVSVFSDLPDLSNLDRLNHTLSEVPAFSVEITR